MGFLDGLLSPLLTQTANARGAYNAGQKQENDKQIANSLQLLTLKRQQEKDDLANALGRAQIGHLNSQSEGQWGQAFQAQDENGPGMFQQHKITGQVRRAVVDGSPATSGGPTAPGASPASNNAGGRTSDALQDVPGDIDLNDPRFNTPSQDTTAKPARVGAGGSPLRPLPKVGSQQPIMGSPEWREAKKFEESIKPKPAPTNVYLTGTDPATGQPTVFAGSSKGTPTLTNMNVGKPAGGAGGSASLSPEDRQKMLVQAKLDNQTMKDFEAKVLAGQAKVGMMAGLAGASSDAHGSVGSNMLGILGNVATGAIDPEYQKYITAQRSYGRIMGNLQSKRYTDHQAEIERSISGLQGNDLHGTIQYKQQLRDASLADPQIAPAQGGGRAAGGQPVQSAPARAAAPTASRAQQLWDSAVAKHGKEKVLQEYGPRPDE